MSPASQPAHGDGEKQESGELHIEHGAKRADAMRGKASGKVSPAPGQRGEQANENPRDGLGRLAFCAETEDGHYFLKIFPDFTFCVGIPQEISGVIGGH